jgi:1,2-diacylglycerol 3-beta-galactosyltransferase
VHPEFSRAAQRDQLVLRSRLGLDLTLPTALLIGGGEGVGPVAEIASQIERAFSAADRPVGQLIVICGRNRALLDELNRRTWSIRVTVRGFVSEMAQWMAASDCIVTKAGPGTIAEAQVIGLPMLLYGYIPGQEEENIRLVTEKHAGIYCPEPKGIAEKLVRWFTDENQPRRRFARNAQAQGNPQATTDIVRACVDLLESRSADRQASRARTSETRCMPVGSSPATIEPPSHPARVRGR